MLPYLLMVICISLMQSELAESEKVIFDTWKIGQTECVPNKIYRKGEITCQCRNDGSWFHKDCSKIFKRDAKIMNIEKGCLPNSYVIFECNVCVCGPDGRIDKRRCTKNKCQNPDIISRRYKNPFHYIPKRASKCENGNWYSGSPCQLCYCKDRTLVCNNQTQYENKFKKESYSLNICGKDLFENALKLMDSPSSWDDISKKINTWKKKINEKIKKSKKPKKPKVPKPKPKPPKATKPKLKKASEKIANVDENSDTDDENDGSEDKTSDEELSTGRQGDNMNENSKEDDKSNNVADETSNYSVEVQFQEDSVEASENENDLRRHEFFESKFNGEYTPISKIKKGKLGKENMKLDSILWSMMFRRSPVTIKYDVDCVPGASEIDKCNTCFCLRNHKLLCTNKRCK